VVCSAVGLVRVVDANTSVSQRVTGADADSDAAGARPAGISFLSVISSV